MAPPRVLRVPTGPGEGLPASQDTPAVGGAGFEWVPHPGRQGARQAQGRGQVGLAAGGREPQGLLIFFRPLQAPGDPTLWGT